MNRSVSRFFVLLLAAGLLGVPARQGRADEGDQGSGIRNRIVETTALVEAVDMKQRLVTLKSEDNGTVSTIKADDSVKNLKQVKKGDRVRIQYNEALVWNLIKKKDRMTPDASSSGRVVSAEPGEMPRGAATHTVHLLADIEKIDKKAPSVTLKGPNGNSETFAVQDPAKLKGVKVGDQVEVTYTESFAVSVEKAPKK